MITGTEERIYEFLKEKCKYYSDYSSLTDENGEKIKQAVTVYRGYPDPDVLNLEKPERPEKKSKFPYIAIRAVRYRDVQTGIGTYDSKCEFEIWTATRGKTATSYEEYINNIKLAEYIQKCLMEEPTINLVYSIETDSEFSVEFFKDQAKPFYISCISFTASGDVVGNKIVENNLEEMLKNQFTGGR